MRKFSLNHSIMYLICLSLGAAETASAIEISFVSGLFRTESFKVDGDDAGEKTEIDVGGRAADALDETMHWFGQGRLTLRSYDKGDLPDAPSNSTSLSVGGGVRYYFDAFSTSFVPFAYAMGEFKNDKDARTSGAGFVEEETNGLFYSAVVGIRSRFAEGLFMDLESPLFQSALFATTKEDDGTTESEASKTELYADTSGALATVIVSVGMEL